MKCIPRSKSGASKARPRWAAHTRIGNVWEYPPPPVIFTRLLGNGTVGSPKWNKQINLVNTCRRTVSQICLFFYLGLYNLYFTKLKSRVTLYRNARGKRTLVEGEYVNMNIFTWICLNMSRSRNVPSQKWERLEPWRECHSANSFRLLLSPTVQSALSEPNETL